MLVPKLAHATPELLYLFPKSEQAFTSIVQTVDMSYKCYEDEYKYLNPFYAQFLSVGPPKYTSTRSRMLHLTTMQYSTTTTL